MISRDCTLSDVHNNFGKGHHYSMNRIEFVLLVRKISVPEPVICGIFVLAAGILVNNMTPDTVPLVIVTTD